MTNLGKNSFTPSDCKVAHRNARVYLYMLDQSYLCRTEDIQLTIILFLLAGTTTSQGSNCAVAAAASCIWGIRDVVIMDAPCSSNNLYAGGAAILAPYQFCDTYG
jgi:hypothetical protein